MAKIQVQLSLTIQLKLTINNHLNYPEQGLLHLSGDTEIQGRKVTKGEDHVHHLSIVLLIGIIVEIVILIVLPGKNLLLDKEDTDLGQGPEQEILMVILPLTVDTTQKEMAHPADKMKIFKSKD